MKKVLYIGKGKEKITLENGGIKIVLEDGYEMWFAFGRLLEKISMILRLKKKFNDMVNILDGE